MNIVFFDIDGTLATGTVIPESAKNALRKLRSHGDIIFICTGRPYTYAHSHFYQYANGFITNNGRYAQIGCCEVMVSESLSDDLIQQVYERVRDIAGMSLFGVKDGYFLGTHDMYVREKERYPYDYLHEGYDGKHPVYSFDLSFESHEQLPALQERLQDLCILNPHGRRPDCDVTIRGFDKGDAIIAVAKHLGVPIENTYAFGDGLNDICMIEKCGHGIAMGNGQPALKAKAEYVTTCIDDHGIYNGLLHYGLIEGE